MFSHYDSHCCQPDHVGKSQCADTKASAQRNLVREVHIVERSRTVKIDGFVVTLFNDDWRRSRKFAYWLPTYEKWHYGSQHNCSDLIKWCKTDYSKDLVNKSYDNIYLRHYITKSWEEWLWKLNTRGMFHPVHRNYEEFFCMNEDLREKQNDMMKMTEGIVPNNDRKVLITGVCGFIGYHLAKRLARDYNVVGIDNLDEYYDVDLKKSRLLRLSHVCFVRCDISNLKRLDKVFETYNPSIVINLAAQAGVGHSITNPKAYTKSNVIGFRNVLECCKKYNVKHLIYASSSSVYGDCDSIPCKENSHTLNPISYYAETKKANEEDALKYNTECSTIITGLRFFTVYGEYGRPDMSYFKIAEKIIKTEPIELYNNGENLRDFTYVGDVVEAICRIIKKGDRNEKYGIYNIGNGNPIKIKDLLNILLEFMLKHGLVVPGQKPNIRLIGKQPGDVGTTCADMSKFEDVFGSLPHTTLSDGIDKFVEWYKTWKQITN